MTEVYATEVASTTSAQGAAGSYPDSAGTAAGKQKGQWAGGSTGCHSSQGSGQSGNGYSNIKLPRHKTLSFAKQPSRMSATYLTLWRNPPCGCGPGTLTPGCLGFQGKGSLPSCLRHSHLFGKCAERRCSQVVCAGLRRAKPWQNTV